MVDASLLNYFQQQVARGHSVQEIRLFLIQKGYPAEIVNECANYIYTQHNVNTDFIPNYVQSNSFTSNAANTGSNTANSNQASISDNNVSNQNNKSLSDKKRPMAYFITGLMLILIILITSYFIFSGSEQEIQELNFEGNIKINKIFDTNSRINIERTINTNSEKGIPVELIYNIYDANQNIIENKEETIYLLEKNRDFIYFNSISKEGFYSIEMIINYQEKSKKYNSNFEIKIESTKTNTATCFDGIKNQNEEGVDCGGECVNSCIKQCPIFYDDNDRCTRDYCNKDTDYNPVHEPIIPCCGNLVCEDGEQTSCSEDCNEDSEITYFNKSDIKPNFELIQSDMPLLDQIKQIKDISKTNILTALEMCGSIIFNYYKDECFLEVAEENSRDDICSNIEDKRTIDLCYTKLSKKKEDYTLCGNIDPGLRRDSCYMRFVFKGDYNVCVFIVDEYFKDTCEKLKEAGESSPEIVEEYAKNIE